MNDMLKLANKFKQILTKQADPGAALAALKNIQQLGNQFVNWWHTDKVPLSMQERGLFASQYREQDLDNLVRFDDFESAQNFANHLKAFEKAIIDGVRLAHQREIQSSSFNDLINQALKVIDSFVKEIDTQLAVINQARLSN